MKKTTASLSFLFGMMLFLTHAYGQGANCASADPFCTDNNYTFPASTNTTAEAGPDYGCLSTQPNPGWYYIQVANSGTIVIDLGSTNGIDDIDFICWGPFNTLGSACSNLTGGSSFCELFESWPCGNIVDCSYSTDATETCTIPNAVSGQYYMFLITNFANVPTDIFANTDLGASTGSTNCAIVPPQGCNMSSLNANIGPCGPGNTYTMTGDFTYQGNPGTGTVIVEVDNGTSTYTQTFNTPFVDGQTYNFSIPGIPADGAPSNISVYFSSDVACELNIDFDAPVDCGCAANIGTQTITMTGDGNTNYVLCYGDDIELNFNGDGVYPDEESASGYTYDPGFVWMVYTCPPTVGINPAVGVSPYDDPCNLGALPPGDIYDINDQSFINAFPAGTFTDNIVYFVPITNYSWVDGIYAVSINGQPDCYDMGTPIAVQYLPEITFTQTTDCASGEATATITGGLPEIDGSQFTAVAGSLTPATASFVNTTCANGGDIVIDGLTSGQTYSFDVEDANGCPITISGTMTGGGGATLTYPQNSYCVNAANPSPTVTGSAGGTFSSTAGLSINAASGVINLSASTPGPYTVTYIGSGGACPPSATFNITVNALPAVSAGPDQTICTGQQVTLTGTGDPGNTYTWSGGVTNGTPFTPGATATYTVTGTSAAGCTNTDDVIVNVDPAASPVFAANITSGCSPLQVTFTNQSGGVNCNWDFGDGSSGTGCGSVTHVYSAVGCYDVTLTTQSAQGCFGTVTLNNYICVTPDPVASFIPVPVEMTTDNPTSTMSNGSTNADTYLWTFEDGSTSTVFEPSHTFPASEGNYSIELVAYSASGCTDTAWAVVVVKEDIIYYVPNTFTPDGDEHNQGFLPVFTSGFDPYNFNMKIFNRWGEVIFETNNHLVGWDGTYHEQLVQDGTFSWKIEFKTSANDVRKVAVGHVNVIR